MKQIISGISFPAIKGKQAGSEYYIVMCPLKRLKRIFTFDETILLPEDRAQRTLNLSRIPQITNYIHNNRDNYTFSSITACIDGECSFSPISEEGHGLNIGTLLVDENAEFYITDGQHRTAAIKQALEEDPSLAEENISVVFFVSKTLAERQKIFRDLNLYPVKTGKSYGVLFGNAPEEKLTNAVAKRCAFFNGIISFDDGNLGPRSAKYFKHSSLHAANEMLFPKVTEPQLEHSIKTAVEYWDCVSSNIPDWQMAKLNQILPTERHEYVNFSAIVLKSLGLLGHQLLANKSWKRKLSMLKTLDWRRTNKQNWEGRCINQGRMSHTNTAAILTLITIKQHLNLPLSDKEHIEENKFKEARNGS